jgi:regulator of replication initiation timing
MEKRLEELEKEELIDLVRQLIAQSAELVAKNAELAAENAELKARLNQNSSNSSAPSSANPYSKPKSLRKKSGKNLAVSQDTKDTE